MSITRNYLRGDLLAPEPEPLKHAPLELGAGRGICADRAGDRADGDLLESALQPQSIAMRLEGKARELDAERRRLGVHPMGTPHAQGVHVLARTVGKRLHQRLRSRHDRFSRRAQLQGERRVEHVRGGQAEVDPTPRLVGARGEHVHERSHIVVSCALTLVDCLDAERGSADRLQLSQRRTLAVAKQAWKLLAGGHLDAPPCLHAGLVGPEGAQLGACVAGDHSLIIAVAWDGTLRRRDAPCARGGHRVFGQPPPPAGSPPVDPVQRE